MRHEFVRSARLLPPLLLALAVAACASQQPAYYVTDSMTGQRVAAGQQAASQRPRGLFGGGASQARASYAYAAPQRQESKGRGLFNSDLFNSSRAPAYAYQPAQPYVPQTYGYRPPQQQAQAVRQAQQPSTMQYRPPQPVPQTYRQPAYAQQPYQAPQPQPGGYYAERYRWY